MMCQRKQVGDDYFNFFGLVISRWIELNHWDRSIGYSSRIIEMFERIQSNHIELQSNVSLVGFGLQFDGKKAHSLESSASW